MKFTNKVVLVLIVFLGFFLRFYKLGEVPAGVYVDEAAIGYNAYALTQTGRDEYGQVFPIFLRSFNAFSSPLYVYLSAIPIAFFGLSAYSVRLLSAISGVLNIIVIYLIIDKLFEYKSKYTSFFAALAFAISPWSIFFSRAAFEANLGLLTLSIAVYLMLFPRVFKYLAFSAFLLGLSTYAYHSLRIIPVFLIPLHFLVFRNEAPRADAQGIFSPRFVGSKIPPKRKLFAFILELTLGVFAKGDKIYNFKKALIIFIIFTITILPQIVVSATPAFRSRAVGLFYSDAISAQADKILFLPGILTSFLSFGREFGSQLLSYFSPRSLFLLGDADAQRSIPDMGVFSMWVIAPYIVGLYTLATKLPNKKALFVGLMMLVFAAPAALARDPFSSLRALNLLIPLSIVIALGLDSLITKIGFKISFVSIVFLTIFSLIGFWRGYFVLLPGERAKEWNYGYQELAGKIASSREHFVIDTSRVKPPHILLAFHMGIAPLEYQAYARTKIIKGYYQDTEFDTHYVLKNFETRPIDWEKDIYKEQVLVGDALAVSEEQVREHFLERVFEIYDPLNKLVFQGYRTSPKEKCDSIRNVNINCI